MRKLICLALLSIALVPVLAPRMSQAAPSQATRKPAEHVSVMVQDTVFRLDEMDGGYRVLFKKHAGVYYLKKDAKSFTEILGALKASKDSGEMVKVTADASSMEIQELTLSTK